MMATNRIQPYGNGAYRSSCSHRYCVTFVYSLYVNQCKNCRVFVSFTNLNFHNYCCGFIYCRCRCTLQLRTRMVLNILSQAVIAFNGNLNGTFFDLLQCFSVNTAFNFSYICITSMLLFVFYLCWGVSKLNVLPSE